MRYKWIRIVFYVLFFGFFLILPVSFVENGQTVCSFSILTGGAVCPGCGVTRAFVNFMHGNFARAYEFHPVLTVFMAPSAILAALADTVCICTRRLSPVDFLWRCL